MKSGQPSEEDFKEELISHLGSDIEDAADRFLKREREQVPDEIPLLGKFTEEDRREALRAMKNINVEFAARLGRLNPYVLPESVYIRSFQNCRLRISPLV